MSQPLSQPLGPVTPALVSIATVTVAAGLGWAPVVEGRGFAVTMTVVATLGVGLTALLARLGARAPLRAGIGLVALVVVAGVAAERDTLVLGLPTGETVGAVLTGLRDGWAQILTVTLPAEASGAPVVTAVAVVWLAATLATELVLRTRAVLLALLPPLIAFAVALVLGAGGRPVPLAVPAVLAASAGAFVLIRTNLAPAHSATATATATGTATAAGPRWAAGAATVAAAALVANVVGPDLPGAGSRERYDVRRLHHQPVVPRAQVNPLATLTAQVSGPERALFTGRVKGTAQRWRVATLQFDGRRWTSGGTFRRIGAVLPPPRLDVPTDEVEQHVTLEGFDGFLLPAVDRPTRVSAEGLAADESAVLAVPEGTERPRRYTVVSSVPRLDAEQLRSAGVAEAGPALELPADVEARVAAATKAVPSAFAKMAALQDHFRSGEYVYDNGPEAPTGNGLYQLRQLFERRRGTAEQFSSAFALMARNLGYPARVAAGYLPGRLDRGQNAYKVSTRDAHAWPEILFEGLGWVAFEPSPLDRRTVPEAAGQEAAAPNPRPVELAVDQERQQRVADQSAGKAAGQAQGPAAGSGRSGRRLALVVALGLMGLWAVVGALLVAVAGIKARRRRRRQLGSPATRIAGAWLDTVERLGEAGVVIEPEMTVSEVVGAPGVPAPAAGALARLGGLANHARFSRADPGVSEADQAWAAAEEVRCGVRAGKSTSSRVLMTVDPGPLLRSRRD